jgi:hypothetical protein
MRHFLSHFVAILVLQSLIQLSWGANYLVSLLDSGASTRVTAWGVSGNSQVGESWDDPFIGPEKAVLWPAPTETPISLHPHGFSSTECADTNGTTQVGRGRGPVTGGEYHALLWHGTADSVIDLHPTGFKSSEVNGGSGYPSADNKYHALLWHGSPASVVDLHPSGFVESYAWDVSGASQVGWGTVPGPGPFDRYHAVLWNGTASSVVDLHPAGFDSSVANGVNGDVQVGVGFGPATGGNQHALLWRNSSAGYTDLHPAGFTHSSAVAVAGKLQVGYASGPTTIGNDRAMAWRGNARSAIDLHSFLSQTGLSFSNSLATDVDSQGNIVGWGDAGDQRYAIRWTLVPEPAPLAIGLLGTSIMVLASSRRTETTPARHTNR